MSRYNDLQLFTCIVRTNSLVGAGRELGITGAAVSKRLMALEQRLAVRLVQRTTRTLKITPEGEHYLQEGKRLLAELDELEQTLRGATARPTGLLRINASLGFGRAVISTILGEFSTIYPDLEVQLHLSDKPLNLIEEGYDIGIRVGELPDIRLHARKLRTNRRLICAAPCYLKKHGIPSSLHDLSQHSIIVLHENEQTFGTWYLQNETRNKNLKVRAKMSTNDGGIALSWALSGFGLILRSEWSIQKLLEDKKLSVVLPEWHEKADIYAVYPAQNHLSAKTRAFIDFIVAHPITNF